MERQTRKGNTPEKNSRSAKKYRLCKSPLGRGARRAGWVLWRKWANEWISEYLVKGFTMDDGRLKGHSGKTKHKEALELANTRMKRGKTAFLRKFSVLWRAKQHSGSSTPPEKLEDEK